MTAPDLTERVIGYRVWQAEGSVLFPWAIKDYGRWIPGVNRASCMRTRYTRVFPDHKLAGQCSCGLHAYHTPRIVEREHWVRSVLRNVPGAIAAWGNVSVHELGFRAEYAEIVALAWVWPTQRGQIKRLAKAYGCKAVPFRKLRREAEKHGAPVPRSLYPTATPHGPAGQDWARAA